MMIGVPPSSTSSMMLGATDGSTRCFLERANAGSAAHEQTTTARPSVKTFDDGRLMPVEIGIPARHRESKLEDSFPPGRSPTRRWGAPTRGVQCRGEDLP